MEDHSSPTGKRYKVATIADMAAIPAPARSRFLAELPEMLSIIGQMHAVNEAVGAKVVKLDEPIWIDDDKGNSTIRLRGVDERGKPTGTEATFTQPIKDRSS